MQKLDLVGKTFGRLKVISKAEPRGKGLRRAWNCQCSCGNLAIVTTHSLRRKGIPTESCGCLQIERAREANLVHGHGCRGKVSNELTIWMNMIARCTDVNQPAYPRYGGRGIKVHEKWFTFTNFLEDVGPRPSKKHSLERINNDGNYEPGNVKWATLVEQARNKRTTRWIEYNGARRCLAEWVEITGISYSVLHARLTKHKWSIEKALTTPVSGS